MYTIYLENFAIRSAPCHWIFLISRTILRWSSLCCRRVSRVESTTSFVTVSTTFFPLVINLHFFRLAMSISIGFLPRNLSNKYIREGGFEQQLIFSSSSSFWEGEFKQQLQLFFSSSSSFWTFIWNTMLKKEVELDLLFYLVPLGRFLVVHFQSHWSRKL